MNDVQKVLCELLIEIDSALSNENIPYSLGDRLCWDAVKYGRFHDGTYDAVILARLEDRKRIERALSRVYEPGRKLVSNIHTSQNACILYADSGTTLVDLSHYTVGSCNNICVTIKLARKSSLFRTRMYLGPGNRSLNLPDGFFESLDRVQFEGCLLTISHRYPELFVAAVGTNWASEKWPHKINHVGYGVIARTDVPGDEFMARAIELGLFNNDVLKNWADFKTWYTYSFKPIEATVYKNNSILGLFEERYRFWDKYMPSKWVLLDRWQAGQKVAVENALEEYLETLKKYYINCGVSICFDEDLFEIAACILEERGVATRDELTNRVPEGHFSPIVI